MPRPIASQEDEDPTPYLFVSLEQRRIDQSKPYDAKKNCWVPDEKEGFLLGEIKATKGDLVTVNLPGGEVIMLHLNTTHKSIQNGSFKKNSRFFNFFFFFSFIGYCYCGLEEKEYLLI